ncbi:ATP-dependent Clp protease ATP-binding subunit ClpA [Lipingzhangella halophila]|uniref:ATP-dependent Clp protease ATP-binding subunit ClpA n=2 Tax=Lipingzhangella halophila TaxID=1783352 RepID=A0A7W7W5S3_9ACTN|nr:ATP-dependent Clp protease ATP-binding subunit ClpA [Lipingzhangella halophila]
MFERFTNEARAAVVGAQREAKREGSGEITPTHILSALLEDPVTTTAAVLTEHGVSADTIAGDLREMRRRAGLSGADAAALDALGIDVEEVVGRVERAHGEYALAGGRPQRRGLFSGHRPFTSEAKRVLEQSLREAIELGDRGIGTEHLLLALVRRPGPARDLLSARGVDHRTVSGEVGRRGDTR